MSARRLYEVFRQEFTHNLRRPLFWVLIALLGFMVFMLANGQAQVSSGDARVGGQKAWITSEFAIAQLLILLTSILYVFFVSVGAGMSVIRDDESKVGELLHSTPLTPGEYLWGKFFAQLASFTGVMAIQLALGAVFNHLIPHGENAEFIGPFLLRNYLRPMLVFGLPTLVLFCGTCFAIGGLTRKPVLVFIAPVAVLLVGAFFLWDWSPNWLPLWANRILQVVDLTGLRWLKENWLLVDRGVDFYNRRTIGLDALIVLQRLACVALGLGSVALLQARFAASLRGARLPKRAAAAALAARADAARVDAVSPGPARAIAPRPLATLEMRSGLTGFVTGVLEVAKIELHELVRHPGLYLFVPMILLQTFGSEFNIGAFDTRLLNTSGILAVGMMNTLTLLICMVILFYTTESLQRERSTGFGPIYYATPLRTGALLAGKAVANTVLGLGILFACLLGCGIVLMIQGKVGLDLRPFALAWGLLLIPTFLMWTAFIGACFALTANRYATYILGLSAMTLTGWFQMRGKMTWLFNWDLWSTTRWTDIATLEYDRLPLLLNRILVLGLAVFFTVFTVRLFARRERDATQTLNSLRPQALFAGLASFTPFLIVPLVAGSLLGYQVHSGQDGGVSRKLMKDYWKKNVETWKNQPTPALTSADLDVRLDPDRLGLAVKGSYRLVNPTRAPLKRFAITVNPQWKKLAWTLDGESLKTENRAALHVVTLSHALAPDSGVTLGFAYEGRTPDGSSRNGGTAMDFILPSSIVLSGFDGPNMVPQLGYNPGVGVEDDKNKSDPREWPEDWYAGESKAALAMAERWFDVHMRVDVPASLQVNATGELVSESVKNGRRITEWRTDHPVRIMNLVAGHWNVKKAPGVAVYYDPRHTYNVDEMLSALSAARRWYGEWFAPLPWKTLRLSEFAGYPQYAQAPPGNITFSENIGFLTRSKPDANAAFWITAHESAHQWWPNQVIPADGPGADALSEGLSHFSTILLVEQARGLEQRMAFCRLIEDNYGNRRVKDSERPLVKMDGSLPGDGRVVYDKGGWAFWMLHRQLGRDASFAALREYLTTYGDNRDHPSLEDFLAVMRRHAADTTGFDAIANQWFRAVVVPEYKIDDARLERSGAGWQVRATIRNAGTSTMAVEVAAARGVRFPHDAAKPDKYQDARTTITLAAGESKPVTIACAFQPEKLVVDPDVTVLMLNRQKAEVKLSPESPLAAAQ